MIDTVLLAGVDEDHMNGTVPNIPPDVEVAEDQWSWIEDTLKASTADYLVVGKPSRLINHV